MIARYGILLPLIRMLWRAHHGGGHEGPRGPWGRGPGGHGGPWGGGPPFGPFGKRRTERLFGRGDLKYVILDLLKDQPRHGYDIIQALEQRFRGFYSPSPGSVYPTLQLLEDQGYVTSTQQDGKRVYSITEAGTSFLAERQDVVDGIHERTGAGWGPRAHPELAELMEEVRQLGGVLFRQAAHGGLRDPDKIRRLRDVVRRTRSEVEAIFGTDSSETFV